MNRYGNCRSHHFQQNLHTTGVIQPLERPDEAGEGARQQADVFSWSKAAVQSRHVPIGVFDQRLDDAGGYGDWSTILMRKNARDADGATYRQPTIAPEIEDDEQVAREKRRLHSPQLSGMTNRLEDPRKVGLETLGVQVPLGLLLAVRLRVNEKPLLVPYKHARVRTKR